ncbi:MAG: Fic family protein, partial [Eubacterium sp.]|nr:Fic family protein [Eubacterium sp.]
MADERNWQFELTEYIKQGEPDRAERSEAWKAAIGLQDVDGLKTSEYLLDTAKEHIEGKIDISTVQKRVNSYYEQQSTRQAIEDGTEEADKVAARIAEMLNENTFQFSPAEYKAIHRRLFADIFKHAGEIRTYNITKKEWVLKGDTVLYASFDSINDTLDYDFGIEKEFSYEGLSAAEAVKHIMKFAAGIWQIHPFCEGNTRATAVFIIKYLKVLGFRVSNDAFSH